VIFIPGGRRLFFSARGDEVRGSLLGITWWLLSGGYGVIQRGRRS
jgi:hypothetical protein